MTDTPEAAPAADLYSVHRVQDGLVERAELDIDTAKSECAVLNAQARQPVGQTIDGIALYHGMVNGEISRYEVRSASGLVVG